MSIAPQRLTEVATVTYSVVVNGQEVARQLATTRLAEAFILTLPESQRSAASIVATTPTGLQILNG